MAGPHRGSNGSQQDELIKDVWEILPLMETFMDHRGCFSWSSSAHQASLIVTPAPVRQKVERKPLIKPELDYTPHRSKVAQLDDNGGYQISERGGRNGYYRQFQQIMPKEVLKESNNVQVPKDTQQPQEEFLQEVLDENSRLRAILKNPSTWEKDETTTKVAIAEELGVLRSQVAALKQMVDAEKSSKEEELPRAKSNGGVAVAEPFIWSGHASEVWPGKVSRRADRARREYLGAVIAARVCKDESLLVLVAEMRLRLQLLFVQL